MSNTIDDFKAVISGRKGLAKNNRFRIFLNPPGIKGGRDVSILCETCSLPGRVLSVVEGPAGSYGTNIKTVSGYQNDEVTMTFHLTNDFFIKRLFDYWHELIVGRPNNQIFTYPVDYSSDVVIEHLNENNETQYTVTLLDAFPQNIQSIPLDNNSTDSTVKLSVTMAYRDFNNY